ncbi:MAG TPA: hypothetical protein VNW94_20970 [Streptosporangiaceae bacterium]|nr:hypothetical protein [Streptosporangiaceae bacterium]
MSSTVAVVNADDPLTVALAAGADRRIGFTLGSQAPGNWRRHSHDTHRMSRWSRWPTPTLGRWTVS